MYKFFIKNKFKNKNIFSKILKNEINLDLRDGTQDEFVNFELKV